MELTWIKCTDGSWCSFNNVNLTHEHFNNMVGVYIIWSGQTVVRVGSGIIKDRIADHRNNPEITAYRDLKVTWASVSEARMQGVGERFPDVQPISVNLPW